MTKTKEVPTLSDINENSAWVALDEVNTEVKTYLKGEYALFFNGNYVLDINPYIFYANTKEGVIKSNLVIDNEIVYSILSGKELISIDYGDVQIFMLDEKEKK